MLKSSRAAPAHGNDLNVLDIAALALNLLIVVSFLGFLGFLGFLLSRVSTPKKAASGKNWLGKTSYPNICVQAFALESNSDGKKLQWVVSFFLSFFLLSFSYVYS